MNVKEKEGNRGFISKIILIIIGLALLKYFFNWSIFDAAASPEGHSTVSYIRDILNTIWSYIATPAMFIWFKIIVPVLSLAWDSFQKFLELGRNAAR